MKKQLTFNLLTVLFLAVELGAEQLSFVGPARIPVQLASPFLWLMLFVRYVYLGGTPGSGPPDVIGVGAKWRVSVTTAVFSLSLPVFFVVFATSGASRSAALAMFVGAPGQLRLHYGLIPETLCEFICLVGIPAFVIAVPEALHSHGGAWRESSPVPAWLAGFAAVLTAVYIINLHFGVGGLAKWPVAGLSVAAFSAAALLAPFYRTVASACWESGITVVFDPGRWWSAWSLAYQEMTRAPVKDVPPRDPSQAEEAYIPAPDPPAAATPLAAATPTVTDDRLSSETYRSGSASPSPGGERPRSRNHTHIFRNEPWCMPTATSIL